MSFGQAISSFFANYVTFSGRSSRSEYWYAVLFLFLASTAAGIIDNATGKPVLQGVFGLATLLPNISVQVRRLHDTDRSGWWMLGLFVPGGFVMGFGFGLAFTSTASKLGGGPALTCIIAGAVAFLVGYVVLLVWNCMAGTPGPNRHGADPLDRARTGYGLRTAGI